MQRKLWGGGKHGHWTASHLTITQIKHKAMAKPTQLWHCTKAEPREAVVLPVLTCVHWGKLLTVKGLAFLSISLCWPLFIGVWQYTYKVPESQLPMGLLDSPACILTPIYLSKLLTYSVSISSTVNRGKSNVYVIKLFWRLSNIKHKTVQWVIQHIIALSYH